MSLRRWLTGPSLALAALIGLAVYPLITAGYPTIGDGWIHFYRLVDLDWNIQQGVLFPRWSTLLGLGHGFPLFNFYPPLTYYLAEAVHLLGLRFDHSLLAVYALGFVLAATGAFVLGRENFGERGGLLSAAAYALAPYLYFDVFGRAALPELLALGELPWALWLCGRLVQQPERRSFAGSVLAITAILLTNIPSALLALPLIAIWGAIRLSRSSARRSLAWLTLSLACATALAGFFLIPAAVELREVQVHRLYLPATLDVRNNFLSLEKIVSWPGPHDPKLVFPIYGLSLSLGAALLATMALLALVLRQPPSPESGKAAPSVARSKLFAWLLLAVTVAAMLPLSAAVWEAVPASRFIQFPWRLLGPASLFLALVAARSVTVFKRPVWLAVAWAICLVASLPWTFGDSVQPPASPGPDDVQRYEISTRQLGTTSEGEYLPRAVIELPAPRAGTVGPLDMASLPAGVQVRSSTLRPLDAEYEIASDEAFRLTLGTFYFPGWRATVDGQPVAIQASSPHGLIEVNVSPGVHVLRVWFGSTPPRTLGALVSLLGVVGLVFLSSRLPRERWSRVEVVGASRPSPLRYEGKRVAPTSSAFLPITVAALLTLRIAFIDGHSTPFSRSRFDGQSVAGVDQPLAVNFEDRFALMGADSPASAVSGEAIDVTLYWRALSVTEDEYSTSIRLIDSEGNVYGQTDSRYPGGGVTTEWRPDRYAVDRQRLPVLAGAPPGRYRLRVALYRSADQALLTALDENGLPIGPYVDAAEVEVVRAAKSPPADALGFDVAVDQSFGPIDLLGYDALPAHSLSPGQVLPITLVWAARMAPEADFEVEFRLTSEGGYAHAVRLPPARADYPTSIWAAGEVVRGMIRLPVPADAPAGPLSISVRLVGAGADYPPIELGQVQIIDVARTWTVPAIPNPLDISFGGTVRLLGYGLETLSGEVQVTLYWQSQALTSHNYAAFVHLLDAGGRVAAQHDGVPVDGTRPTSGWLPGEVLVDRHSVAAAAGEYLVEVGLYEVESGRRLLTEAGEDRVIVGRVVFLT